MPGPGHPEVADPAAGDPARGRRGGDRRAGAARGAAGDAGAGPARPSRRATPAAMLGAVPEAGLRPGRCRHRAEPALGRGGAARRRGRLRRGRRGDGGRGARRVLRHAPARPPCRGHGGHGLLRVQQRRGGGAAGAGRAQAVAARDLRFRRASRQRHAEHVLRRPGHALRLDPPVAALSRAPASPRERGIKGNILNRPLPPGTGSEAWRRVVERDVLPAIDALAAAADLRLGRLRRPRRGPARQHGAGRGRLRLGHARAVRGSPTGTATGALSRSWRAAMTRRPWRAASWRTCRCWPRRAPD